MIFAYDFFILFTQNRRYHDVKGSKNLDNNDKVVLSLAFTD